MSSFPPARKSFSRICFIGDAFTVGAGDETTMGWVGRLAKGEWDRGHDISVYNLGIRGNSSRDIARRWKAECRARLPEGANGRLVFMFGGNDAKGTVGEGVEVPVEEALAHARTFMGEAAAWLPTLWIGLIPMNEAKPYPQLLAGGPRYRFSNERQALYNARYAGLAAELGIPFLDLHTSLVNDSRWMELTQEGDGSNPAGEGYALLADRIAQWPAWRAWFDR